MPSFRTVAAALAAVAVAGVQATEHELPPCLDPFQPFVYSGCFRDLGNPSALVWRTPLDQQNMTVETCTSACKGNGFRYAGLAYYGVCYCGQTVNGPELDESQCSYPCTGDKSQTCGGDNILSIYTDPTFLPLDEAKVEDYDALGCYTDDSPLGRALTYRQDIEGPLTTEKCLKKCRDGGFPFAGTEYASMCLPLRPNFGYRGLTTPTRRVLVRCCHWQQYFPCPCRPMQHGVQRRQQRDLRWSRPVEPLRCRRAPVS